MRINRWTMILMSLRMMILISDPGSLELFSKDAEAVLFYSIGIIFRSLEMLSLTR